MSEAAATQLDLLPLPGFPPDAVPFAIRTALALLLAYLVSFAIQLDAASSAGVCVAIVAQPSPGMTLSKAVWRAAGTILGGIVSLLLIAAFPQDRTMLLLCFTLWLGGCTFVAALLRDFRSYGAVLCGYTVGIIAIIGIDTPDGALVATLDRVAAILIGILSVAAVNTLLARPTAYATLLRALQGHLAAVRQLAIQALESDAPDAARQALFGERASLRAGAAILALRTQAVYAATELPGGRARRDGAVAAIAGLLSMLSAIRALAAEPIDPALTPWRSRAAAALRTGAPPSPAPAASSPAEAFAAERTEALLFHHAMAAEGVAVLAEGGRVRQRVDMRVHSDVVGAAQSAIRTVIAVGAGSVFCVLAGWPGASGVLVQQAAFTALLGMTPNPTAAGEAMGAALIPASIAAAVAGFVLMPLASGFVPFALVVAPLAFALSLAGRYPPLQRFGAGFLLYFTLLLAPSNVESFDLSSFVNNEMVQVLAVAFMILAFRQILPVSRRRRLFRIADAIIGDLAGTLRRGRSLDEAATHLREYDRMQQAQTWAGRPTPASRRVIQRLTAMIDLDLELRRAWSGLVALPGAAATQARAALLSHDPARMRGTAWDLSADGGGAMATISGLHAAARLLEQEAAALRHYGVLRA